MAKICLLFFVGYFLYVCKVAWMFVWAVVDFFPEDVFRKFVIND